MKQAWLTLALVMGLVLAAGAQAPDIGSMDVVERATPDGPVARVRGSNISRGAFLYLYRTQLVETAALTKTKSPGDDMRVRVALTVLADLVRREVLFQEGERRHITVSEAAVTKAYDEQMNRLRQMLKASSGKEVTEEQVLERSGQPKSQALVQIRKSMVVEKTIEAIAKEENISVSDDEVRAFYEEHPEFFSRPGQLHLKHIYIRPGKDPATATDAEWADARDRMNKALARMQAGESFEAVARDMSDSPTASAGGDLGEKPAHLLPPDYVKAAQKLDPGRTSGILEDKNGLHMVRLVETTEGESINLDRASDKIRKMLLVQKGERAADTFVQPILADSAQVRVFLQLERALANRATGH